MKNSILYKILISFICINCYTYSQVLWEKYFVADSIRYDGVHSIFQYDNKIFFVSGGLNSNDFYNSGFIITDIDSNYINRFELLKNKHIMIKNLSFENNKINIFSALDYKSTLAYYMGDWKIYPHKIILNQDLNIEKEMYDTNNSSFYSNLTSRIIFQDDSIYVRRSLYDSTKKLFDDLITVLDNSTSFVRNIALEPFKDGLNNSASTVTILTKDKHFLILSKSQKKSAWFIQESELAKLDYNGNKVWVTKG